jgi:Recombination endonuclease VII
MWTCRRQANGILCRYENDNRKKKCGACGKPKPPRRRPRHLAALEDPYEQWVARYGETCGICGRGPSPTRRLDRDHDHATGMSRGLLCARCNRQLRTWVTVDWLRRALRYLERT